MDLIEKVIERIKISIITKLKNKTVMVTGATGLIGSFLVRYFVANDVNVIAVARNIEKAKKFDFYPQVKWVFKDLLEEYNNINYDIDYIIHTASPTDSNYFVTHPVETINQTINGMFNILQLAVQKKVKGFVFTSSMEVYGICRENRFLKEDEYYSIDCTNIRNSYAEGKKMLECIAFSYGAQYKIPIKVVRLCQTFGPGVSPNDNRVFAQFARSVVDGRDIILSTKGETKRSYCSLADAIQGIVLVLLNGENNNVYNVASDDSYYSIKELAEMFVQGREIKVIIDEQSDRKYLPTIQFGLNTDKIKAIGFNSADTLPLMVKDLLDYYQLLKKGI